MDDEWPEDLRAVMARARTEGCDYLGGLPGMHRTDFKKKKIPKNRISSNFAVPIEHDGRRGVAEKNFLSVRKCMRIKRTPNDAGTKLTIEFTYYDNGFVSINGSPKGDYTPDEAERWLASTRFIMQMIEEFRNYINKSKTSAAA
jgi:hypothetical protein